MRKTLICLLLFTFGNSLFAANVANPRSGSKGDQRFRDEDPKVVIVKEMRQKKQNFFSISLVGTFNDMLNDMFKSGASIEASWVYEFEKYVSLELGMDWSILGEAVNDASVIFGIGFKPVQYYEPEIFIVSQFLGGYDFKVGLRNNIKIDGAVRTKLFLDVGVTNIYETKAWTYFLGLGVGFEI